MSYFTYSHSKNLLVSNIFKLLEGAQKVYVVKAHSYWELHIGSYPDDGIRLLEMELSPMNMFSKLTPQNIAIVNKVMRWADDSHLWPVNNRFNVTERAIRKLRKDNPCDCPWSYWQTLEQECSRIVNSLI